MIRLTSKNLIKIPVKMEIFSNAKPLILCGPSGVGKSTLVNRLLQDFPNRFGFCVSDTTRKRRNSEQNGVHYNFVRVEDMEREINEGKFVEHALFDGNLYGTSKKAIADVHKLGKICILDIDIQGVMKIRESNLNPWYVFIRPPTLESLQERLRLRNTESSGALNRRLEIAKKDIEAAKVLTYFDLNLVNDSLDDSYKQLKEFVQVHIFNVQ